MSKVDSFHAYMQATKDMAQSVVHRYHTCDEKPDVAWELIEEVMQGLIDVFLYMFDKEENTKNTPTVDVVTWKDFKDFLDDNAEDFESIGKRLDALEERLNAIEKKPTVEAIPIEWLKDQAEDTTFQHRVEGLIERWRREHE